MAKRFARYELVGELGRGGQAVVHEAFDPELGRAVALKVLLPGVRSLNSLERFQREARAAAKLTHPNIISIYHVGEWQGRHYIAMELVEGRSLEGEIAAGRIPVRDAVDIIRQLADAAHSAHEQGIVHRDIKPANTLIDADGRPKLTDFGFALDVDAHTQLTQTGAVMGTPAYMPPEQARGRAHAVDARGDVYSLGAVLYEMLTGRPPFEAESSLMLLNKIVYEPPKNPSELRPVIPVDAATIALKCLEKERGRRYQTAAGLARDCKRFLAGESISARRASFTYQAKKTFGRHRGVIAAAVVVVLALAGVGAWVYLGLRNVRARIARLKKEADRHEAEEAQLHAEAKELLRTIRDLKRRKTQEPAPAPLPSKPHGPSLLGRGGLLEKGEVQGAPPTPGTPGQRQPKPPPNAVTRKKRPRKRRKASSPGSARAKPLPGDDDAKAKEVVAGGGAEGKLAPLMAEFDSLVKKGDYAGAKRWSERAARDPANAGVKGTLLAAARVAGLLEERRQVIRRAAEELVGEKIILRTERGEQEGELDKVTETGLVLAFSLRGRGTGSATGYLPVAWSALTPEQEDAFAADWEPAGAEGAIAKALVVYSRRGARVAERFLGSQIKHHLADYYRDRFGSEERARADSQAREAWRAVEEQGKPRDSSVPRARALLDAISDFEKRHGKTGFASSIAQRIELTKATAKLRLQPPRVELGDGVVMMLVYIAPGQFTMGRDDDGSPGTSLAHKVAITKAFYVGKYEVTREQFSVFVRATGHVTEAERKGRSYAWEPHGTGLVGRITNDISWRNANFPQRNDEPVICVSWNDAGAFCSWLSRKMKMTFRLPTEAEWEYVCRAGSMGDFCFGNDARLVGKYAWHRSNAGLRTHAVGTKLPNTWGLYDVHGNVSEWVADWYDELYYAKSPPADPIGPRSGQERVVRSGSWLTRLPLCATRNSKAPSETGTDLGFRVALDP